MRKSILRLFRSLISAASVYFLAVGFAQAVTIYFEVETEGEPIPEATISFETPEGEEIDLEDLFEEEIAEAEPNDPSEDGEAREEEEEPEKEAGEEKQKPEPSTDEEGTYASRLPDSLLGSGIIVVISQEDKVITRLPIEVAEENPVYVEAFDPAAALLGLSFVQQRKCTAGKTCPLTLVINNEGTSIYEGPLFLEVAAPGNWASAAKNNDDIFCSRPVRGKSFCTVNASVQPGDTQTWALGLPLAGTTSSQPRSCLSFLDVASPTSSRNKPLVRALQLGLLREGYSVGRPDGIAGNKTRATTARYWRDSGQSGEFSQVSEARAALFEALFGYGLQRFAKLGTASDPFCKSLSVIPTKKKTTTKNTSKPRSKSTKKSSKNDKLLKDALKIGIGIGVMHLLKKNKGHGHAIPLE